MQPKKMENHKFFAPIALIICIAFAAYAGMLAAKLNKTISSFDQSQISLEERLENIEKTLQEKN